MYSQEFEQWYAEDMKDAEPIPEWDEMNRQLRDFQKQRDFYVWEAVLE